MREGTHTKTGLIKPSAKPNKSARKPTREASETRIQHYNTMSNHTISDKPDPHPNGRVIGRNLIMWHRKYMMLLDTAETDPNCQAHG